jgi:phosphoserine aminotransferase
VCSEIHPIKHSPEALAGIRIPAGLLPSDGRFGCGPSRVGQQAVDALAAVATTWLGTSHRQAPVKRMVGSIRSGLSELFSLPDGWEIVLGNGGSSLFWDAATFGLIEGRSEHLVFGEFSAKFAEAAAKAPFLGQPVVIESPTGDHPQARAEAGIDAYALTHNETSTGVSMQLQRPLGAAGDALVLVDATSGAGGLAWSPAEVDVYYFAPQKCFASDGGLWLAACSPAAVARIERISAGGRWVPGALDLKLALDNSRQQQTVNTPALATLFLLDQQIRWMLSNGGLAWCVERTAASAAHLYGWAATRPWASPFVADPAKRSNVVGTIDLHGLQASDVNTVLRANGVVDTDSYRKLGRNQLRVGMFPAVPTSDVQALTASIDYVAGALG